MIEANKPITIYSASHAVVVLTVPALNLRRRWAKQGAIQKIPFETLQMAFYEPGVEALFKSGILYIEDMEAKITLGLEEEGTEQPTNVVFLTEELAKKILTGTPIKNIPEELDKLTGDQCVELAQYAVKFRITDMARCNLIKERSGVDVLKKVMFAVQMDAEDASAEAEK